MTRIYHYVLAGTVVNGTSQIYKVSIGTGAQARRDFLFLTAYSVDHGHYFEIQSVRSSEFIHKLQTSLDDIILPIQHVSARELVRALKAGTIPDHSQSMSAAALIQEKILNAGWRVWSSINRKRNSDLPSRATY